MFSQEIDEILSSKLHSYRNVIITGDFNIDLLKLKDSLHINNFFETIIANGYLPKITLPTRLTSHSSTLIDNCYVKLSSNFSKTTAGILNYNISDHQPYLTLDYLSITIENQKFIQIFTNTPIAKDNFKNEIGLNCTTDKFCTDIGTDPNVNYNLLNDIIQNALNKHLPVKLVRYNKYKHKKSKWITAGIMRSIKFRDKLYAKLRATPSNSSDYNKYKINLQTYNRILRQNIRLAKKTYYHKCFENFKHDIKSTWTTLKEILNKNHKIDKIPKYFLINDLPESDPTIVVNKFNTYFTEIGPRLASTLSFPANKSYRDYLNNPTYNHFEFSEINKQKVIEIIDKLKPKSSCGIDRLSNKLLKLIKIEISESLTLIINQSINTGLFPNKLKTTKVLPLFKKNENYVFDNYRPASVLPSLSKVIEKVMHIQLYDYFNRFDFLYDNQYGFRTNHSTELATLEIINRIVSKMDKKIMITNQYLSRSLESF